MVSATPTRRLLPYRVAPLTGNLLASDGPLAHAQLATLWLALTFVCRLSYKDHNHAGKRRRVHGPAEFESAAAKANFPGVGQDQVMEPPRVGPGG